MICGEFSSATTAAPDCSAGQHHFFISDLIDDTFFETFDRLMHDTFTSTTTKKVSFTFLFSSAEMAFFVCSTVCPVFT